MKKCLDLVSALLNEYADIRENLSLPSLQLRHSPLQEEAFDAEYAAGTVTVSAPSSLSGAYGVSLLSCAMQSGFFAEFLGVSAPRYSLRPLWLGSPVEVVLSPRVSIYLPKFIFDENAFVSVDDVCKRLIEGGYNALLFGSKGVGANGASMVERIELDENLLTRLNTIFSQIKEVGIKIIIKPLFAFSLSRQACVKCPYDPIFCEYVEELFQEFFSFISDGVDYIFWESMLLGSNYRYHRNAQDVTEVEAVSTEVQLVENCLLPGKKLIFFLPAYSSATALRQSSWISTLLDEMGDASLLAFSTVAGDICEDQKENHPFWKALRNSPDSSATPILPIVNLGLVGQGENLWPTSNRDLIDRFLPRCHRHPFAGIISFWNYLPRKASIGDCNFFIAGHSIKGGYNPELLAETWFAVFRPDEDFSLCWELLQEARRIVLGLSRLRLEAIERGRDLWGADLPRITAVGLLNGVRILLLKSELLTGKSNAFSGTSMRDYFSFFATDIARFLRHLMPSLSHSEFQGISLEDSGFWSCSRSGKTFELQKKSESFFPLEPQSGQQESIMSAIYYENRFPL